MAYTINAVVSQYFPLDDFIFTYNISGAVTQADLGKALTLDTAAPNTMRLAADGEAIHGRLFSYEDRTQQGGGKVGAVERKFKAKVPAGAGHGIAVGDAVTGSATLGVVKKAAAQTDPKPNLVIEVGTDFVVVEKL